jgi:hypothetical protein
MKSATVSLAQTASWLRWLAQQSSIPGNALSPLCTTLLRCLERDRTMFEDVLEASISWEPNHVSYFRFSYAFPEFRTWMPRTLQALRLLHRAGELSHPKSSAFRRLLPMILEPCVEQPLFGFADDSPSRHKLYLQFAAGQSQHGKELLCSYLHKPWQSRLQSIPGELHLVGFDIIQGHVQRMKLYFEHPTLPIETLERSSLLSTLGKRFSLHRSLLIYRCSLDDSPLPSEADEIDFSLTDNGIQLDDIINYFPIEVRQDPRLAHLRQRFTPKFRRLSLSLSGSPKINLYYSLPETIRDQQD